MPSYALLVQTTGAQGVAIAGCELIGLAPMAAFADVIRHYLQLHDFSVEQVIESRLLGV